MTTCGGQWAHPHSFPAALVVGSLGCRFAAGTGGFNLLFAHGGKGIWRCAPREAQYDLYPSAWDPKALILRIANTTMSLIEMSH
eukprot:CAMPEP_0174308898 /NCGR_PEP_ID=MMETSP0810-20121108/2049_1 /TAXON_ID=73025 ORGANISM="Eutreptiella gymnastica-like, Strain CCMP1594" /NCGR_SAMPLE_ID=MMETSP0810 /ASSEMBLY_ACC=CAM_ASM_000659 /LENGTH=83 /DNA_ID=CAMNT_0015416349 /DNA_START=1063 /DNA_END=1314 /DNA_ORIENTATION=-